MIKAVIVDDEARARNVLQSLLTEFHDNVIVAAEADNVVEAIKVINKAEPDVVFLDIDMPGYKGYELVEFFKEIDFEIVFVTAHQQYALKAFEVSAIDFLLKPVNPDQLEKALQKVEKKLQLSDVKERLTTLQENLKSKELRKIALPVSDGLLFVELAKIEMLEAEGAYTYVLMEDNSKILVSKRIKFFEEMLGDRNDFFRVHRSSIININFVNRYSRNEGIIRMENGNSVKVARDRKTEFEASLSGIKI